MPTAQKTVCLTILCALGTLSLFLLSGGTPSPAAVQIVLAMLLCCAIASGFFRSRGRLPGKGWAWALGCGTVLTLAALRVCHSLGASPLLTPVIWLLISLCCGGLFAFFSSPKLQPASTLVSRQVGFGVFLFVSAALGLLWWFHFPAGLTGDSRNQLAQVYGAIPYTDIHTLGHTLLIKASMVLTGHYWPVIALHILGVAFLYTCFAVLLCHRGIPQRWIFLLLALFTASGTHADLYVYLLKDTPFALCVGAVTLFIIRSVETPKPKAPFSFWQAGLLGIALAYCMLFRSNGGVVLAFCGLFFILYFAQRHAFRCLAGMLLGVLLSIGMVQALSSLVLHAQHLPNGFALAPFGKGIAAVVANEEPITSDQQALLDAIFQPEDILFMKEQYLPWDEGNRLLWYREYLYLSPRPDVFLDPSLEVMNNRFVMALGQHPWQVVQLYFSLLPGHLSTCLKDILYNTYVIWGLDAQAPLFSHVVLSCILLLAMAAAWNRAQLRRYWPILLPITANTFSIAISAVTNEYRYLLPTYLLFPVVLPLILSCKAHPPSDLKTEVYP